jgi:hypothetical protein
MLQNELLPHFLGAVTKHEDLSSIIACITNDRSINELNLEMIAKSDDDKLTSRTFFDS